MKYHRHYLRSPQPLKVSCHNSLSYLACPARNIITHKQLITHSGARQKIVGPIQISSFRRAFILQFQQNIQKMDYFDNLKNPSICGSSAAGQGWTPSRKRKPDQQVWLLRNHRKTWRKLEDPNEIRPSCERLVPSFLSFPFSFPLPPMKSLERRISRTMVAWASSSGFAKGRASLLSLASCLWRPKPRNFLSEGFMTSVYSKFLESLFLSLYLPLSLSASVSVSTSLPPSSPRNWAAYEEERSSKWNDNFVFNSILMVTSGEERRPD